MSSHGTYETHVTVRCPDARELARLESWADARELRVTHPRQTRGRPSCQPMLTLPDRTGHERLVPQLRAAGFHPIRVKIETVPWTTDLPGPGGGYYEHHLRLLLPDAYDHGALEALVVPHGAHLSAHSRRAPSGTPDGQERFVTQRCRGSASRATAACDTLIAELVEAGYEIGSEEREFVLYDSDLSVEELWTGGRDDGRGDGRAPTG
ncbi:hypothetical protein [Streptomyces sp. NPDC048606]|uniref:hypothetical protein n=1 Tax=Streptomyces sp. NPDC048606 TaxID=3154726 RepID=UPI003448EBD5